MKQAEGDPIRMARSGEFDLIVHGRNRFCATEAGIARIIARGFPAAHAADHGLVVLRSASAP